MSLAVFNCNRGVELRSVMEETFGKGQATNQRIRRTTHTTLSQTGDQKPGDERVAPPAVAFIEERNTAPKAKESHPAS
jgi:hypothetical protein